MINISRVLYIAYSTLLNSIPTYGATANINGVPINLQATYNNGTLTLQGDITIQATISTLTIEIYIGNYPIDSISLNVTLSPGTYTFIYTLTITDSTGIINNAFGYAVTNQLKSVSISTNSSSYIITETQNMLTFYLEYTSYPSSVSISVTFTLTNGSTVNGSYTASLPQGTTLYGIVIPVTFEV
ncbi:SIFV.gp61-like protein [Sulfolobus islandicus filamentous virus 2]|uniref:SIFV.gp61-like protein n=1 Tax=Sulfolobus islandicus filamentous virus 2 TaxID=1902331 RepID=A0A1D8BJB8_SIFV|nr:SIFV.gp61-like protein [Sulfolobus islandicus filamentous virus 2]